MTLLPNYLYDYVFSCILEYLYRKPSIPSSRDFSICINNNEVIGYATINKSLYNIISSILKKLLNFSSFKLLRNLIDYKNPTLQEFGKLIPLKDSVAVYSSYDITNKNIDTSVYKKILIEVSYPDFECPQNARLNIIFRQNPNFDLKSLVTNFKNENIRKVSMHGNNFTKEEKKALVDIATKTGVKKIRLYGILVDDDISPLFNLTQLTALGLSECSYPKYVAMINNQNTKLKKLRIESPGLNEDMEYNDSETIHQDFKSMVETLSKNTTIKKLEILEFNYLQKYINELEIVNGFKTIFTSPFFSVESLKITTSSHFLNEAMIHNKTIKNLELIEGDLDNVIRNILVHNRTIRNITTRYNSSEEDLNALKLLTQEPYSSTIDLYSITFYVQRDEIQKYKKMFKYHHFPVREFNIRPYNYTMYGRSVSSQIVVNNSILNIIQQKGFKPPKISDEFRNCFLNNK
ncbi:hypothetical protein DICPUDRAFT_74674 [Dictyostelium purpureum]|uniref:Uncharacterized protein n=1 Tax=Dictyostelium purpureum TaxID=5786 RepID=F0Z8L7_DICPU|nr:uncharacterized protein DICPUDRAFT_74674 [Dictyostelium purpureum]EGC39749.1 hypothetical protein DICPUDRAFT_74674 [Dictyostelium purpureum]|eukprot:XP_003283735.1 hypothetical protein DICPUDRAFT_74674 [Dictyostelium purpureum]